MPLVEEGKRVEMVKRLETGIDITEKVLGVARRHVAELVDSEVWDPTWERDRFHHLRHLGLQTGRIDLAVEVHLVEGRGLGACWGQGVVVVELRGLGADQVWGLPTCELVVRGLLAKVGLTHLDFHILARRKRDATWAW